MAGKQISFILGIKSRRWLVVLTPRRPCLRGNNHQYPQEARWAFACRPSRWRSNSWSSHYKTTTLSRPPFRLVKPDSPTFHVLWDRKVHSEVYTSPSSARWNQFMPSRPIFVMSILIVLPAAFRFSKLYSTLQVFCPKPFMYACVPRALPTSDNEAPHMRFGPPPVTVRSSFQGTHFSKIRNLCS